MLWLILFLNSNSLIYHSFADDLSVTSLANQTINKNSCFDFSQPIMTALLSPKKGTNFGKTERFGSKLDYAYASQIIQKPLLTLLNQLIDPKTFRNNSNTTVTIQELSSKHFLRFFEESVQIKPTFFLTLNWKEKWAVTLVKGNKNQPEEILVSYQKSEGTSHVKHLCGNIWLKAINNKETEVFLYQELDATRRDAKDILNDLNGTLKTVTP